MYLLCTHKSALSFLNSMAVHPGPLPWREGDPSSARRKIQTTRLPATRCALLPLPAAVAQERRFGAPRRRKGEDQGEGKRREVSSRVSDHSRNCQTGRVLLRSQRFRQMNMTNSEFGYPT